jgi:hypothetical protein
LFHKQLFVRQLFGVLPNPNSLRVIGRLLSQPECIIIKEAFEGKLPKEAAIVLFDSQNYIMALDASPAQVTGVWAENLDKPADNEYTLFETSDDDLSAVVQCVKTPITVSRTP